MQSTKKHCTQNHGLPQSDNEPKLLDFANTSSKILTTQEKTELHQHAATRIARGSLIISFFEKEVTK